MADRFYESYTYRRVTKTRTIGGKISETVTDYENCPLVFVQPSGRVEWTQDGLYKEARAHAHIASRFFDIQQFTPSLNDMIIKGDIVYRIIDLQDYTYHPHINVYSVTLKRIEYHG